MNVKKYLFCPSAENTSGIQSNELELEPQFDEETGGLDSGFRFTVKLIRVAPSDIPGEGIVRTILDTKSLQIDR